MLLVAQGLGMASCCKYRSLACSCCRVSTIEGSHPCSHVFVMLLPCRAKFLGCPTHTQLPYKLHRTAPFPASQPSSQHSPAASGPPKQAQHRLPHLTCFPASQLISQDSPAASGALRQAQLGILHGVQVDDLRLHVHMQLRGVSCSMHKIHISLCPQLYRERPADHVQACESL